MTAPRRILVRMPNWVGDVVMATPALRAIRASFAQACVSILIKPGLAKILEGLDWYNEVIPYEPHGAKGYLSLALRLRRARFDMAVILPNSFNSAFLIRLAGIPRRVGYALNGRSFLLTDAVPVEMQGLKRKPIYMGDYYSSLCVRAGCKPGSQRLELAVSEKARSEADELLERLGIARGATIVGLCPGASFGPSKLWPAERFAAVGDELARRRRAAIVIFHGPGEEQLAGEVQRHMHISAPVIHRGFDVFKALVERCSLLIGTDSGHRHFAVALDTPVIVLMGPTSRDYTDGNLEGSLIIQKSVECGPCQLKECPLDRRCMLQITAEEVVAAAEQMLEGRKSE